MIVEDQLDRGAGRIGGIEKLEEFDELAAAVALPDERVDLAGEQIDPGQQADARHGVCTHDPARSSHGGLAPAANPAPSWRWPGSAGFSS